jgi:hypothetical protein
MIAMMRLFKDGHRKHFPPSGAVAPGWNHVSRHSRICALIQHDKKSENPGGQHESGQENPEEPDLVPITPPSRDQQAEKTGEGIFTENPSWNCACN